MRYSKPKSLIFILFILLMGIGMPHGFSFESRPFVNELLKARQNQLLTPNFSEYGEMTMSDAYAVQVTFVKDQLKTDEITGFKAGLTSQKAQELIGINRAVFGVLLKSGDLSHTPSFSLNRFHQLTIETELGFITNRPIRHVVHSVEELKQYIGRVVPVIEMPDLGFKLGTFNIVDLVASNTAFAGYIVGSNTNWINEDINLLSVTLFHDGKIINQGQGKDALGDQWEALRWLVNQVVSHGWTIEKGHIFITGALGEIVPARPGVYRAQFNNEATIEFTILAT